MPIINACIKYRVGNSEDGWAILCIHIHTTFRGL